MSLTICLHFLTSVSQSRRHTLPFLPLSLQTSKRCDRTRVALKTALVPSGQKPQSKPVVFAVWRTPSPPPTPIPTTATLAITTTNACASLQLTERVLKSRRAKPDRLSLLNARTLWSSAFQSSGRSRCPLYLKEMPLWGWLVSTSFEFLILCALFGFQDWKRFVWQRQSFNSLPAG